MGRWLPWVLLTAAACAAAFLVLGFGFDEGDPSGAESLDEGAVEEAALGGPRLLGAGEATRRVDKGADSAAFVVRGRVVDGSEKPLAGLSVGIRHLGGPEWNAKDPARWGDLPEEAFRKTVALLEAAPQPPPPPDDTTTTGDDGSFTFRIGRSGSYEVRAVVEPPLASTRPTAWVSPQYASPDLTVSVAAGTTLRGRVVDPTGGGVESEVSGIARRDETASWQAGPVASGADGTFVMEAMPAGDWRLTVRVPGRLTLRGVPVTLPREEPLEIRIGAEGGVITGTVTDPGLRPVPEATLMITVAATAPADADGSLSTTLRATTGSDGTYRVEGAPLGTVTAVSAHASAFAVHRSAPPLAPWAGATVVARGETRLDVRLEPGAVVEGRVLEAGTGKALADVEVFVALASGPFGGGARPFIARSGADGAYRIEGVPPGRALLLARAPRHYLKAAMAEVGETMSMGPGGPMGAAGSPPELTLVIGPEGGTVRRDLTLEPGLKVRGEVVDPTGATVEGAEVVARGVGPGTSAWRWGVQWPGGYEVLGRTDAEGRFEATPLPPHGALVLFARKAPFVGGASEPLALAAGAEVPEVTLRLEAGAALSGRVVGPDGSGVAGVTVTAWGQWTDQPTSTPYSTSDGTGAFRFEGLPLGDLTLGASTPKLRSAQLPVEGLKSGEVRGGLEVRLEEGVRVAGVLADGDGKPLPHRRLMLHGMSGGPGNWARTTTQLDGTFEFLAAPRGRVMIQLEAQEGYGSRALAGGQVEAPADGLRLVCTPVKEQVIEGTVMDAAGVLVPLCEVHLEGTGKARRRGEVMSYPRGGGGNECVNGRFRCTVQGEPPYQVTASRARDAQGRPLNLRPGSATVPDASTPVEIRLEEGLRIAGQVVGPGRRGVAGAAVSGGGVSAVTDMEGAFTLAGLAEGEVSVSCRPPAGMVVPPALKVRAGTDDVRFDLRAGLPVAGTVLGPDGNATSQAYVSASWPASAGSAAGSASAQVQQGRFRIEGVPEGVSVTLQVRAWNMNGAQQAAPVQVEGVTPGTTDVVVRLEEGAVLAGVVLDADGKPFSAAWIAVSPDTGGKEGAQTYAQIQQDGSFRLTGLARGPYRLDVRRQDNGPPPESTRVSAPASGIRIQMPLAQRIAGRVSGTGDLAGFAVYAWSDGNPNSRWSSAAAASDGSFTFEGIGGGAHTLSARRKGDDRYALVTGVNPGSTGVDLPLRVGLSIEGRIESDDAQASLTIHAEGEGWRADATVGKEGSFHLRGLPPGRYTLTARSSGGGTARQQDVVAGTTGVRLRLMR